MCRVAVYHPEAGYCSIYTNGALAAINSSITILLTDATSTGDPYNYIGQSLYMVIPICRLPWMNSTSTKAP